MYPKNGRKFRKYSGVCVSCGEDKGGKGVQESTDRIGRREKTSWKAEREVVRCCGQGC
jgi:hypothetical protein